jgi:hypothetical protein
MKGESIMNRKPVIFLITLFTFVNITAQEILDQAIPGAQGCGITVHVEAGKNERDFQLTYEKMGSGGYYLYYNGTTWSQPLQVIADAPFRSGVHMAVDSKNHVHFAWINGPSDRGGNLKYRKWDGNILSNIEIVHTSQGWNECDIAVDNQDGAQIAANTSSNSVMARYYRTGAQWQTEPLPANNSEHKWAPTIVCTKGGKIYITYRRKDGHPFVWQAYFNGKWSLGQSITRTYEPNGIAVGEDLYAASLQGRVYFVKGIGTGPVRSYYKSFGGACGIIRGQHVGIGMTDRGMLYLSYSNMTNTNIKDRTITQSHRYFYALSPDSGNTWTQGNVRLTQDNSGQGHGNMAVNRTWIMFVWPDMRQGLHLRYSLKHDGTVGIDRPAGSKSDRGVLDIKAGPNPAGPHTTMNIECRIPNVEYRNIDMGIFDLQGQLIKKNNFDIRYSFNWKTTGYPAGIYILKAEIDNRIYSKRLILTR